MTKYGNAHMKTFQFEFSFPKTLNRALTKMHNDGVEGPYYKPVHTYTLNPKAVTAGELYGEVNPFTMEWRDGLIGIMTRTAVTVSMIASSALTLF